MPQKKKSFYKILKIMEDFDNEVEEISQQDFQEALGELPDKIDGCKDFINVLESRMIVHQREIEYHSAIIKTFNSTLTSFKKYLTNTMINLEVDKLQGEKHVLSLGRRTSLKFKDIEIDSDVYMSLNMLAPHTVKRAYAINATGFKKLCEKNPEIKDKYAVESTSTFPQFRINRSKP